MNRHSFARLLAVLAITLALHAESSHASVGVGGACDPNDANQLCAAGLVCGGGTCNYPGDKIKADLQQCKDKLIKNGMSPNGLAALHDKFCYEDASCPEVYQRLKGLGHATESPAELVARTAAETGRNMTYREAVDELEANSARNMAAAQQKDAAVIKAAAEACRQCTVGGKPRCFSN